MDTSYLVTAIFVILIVLLAGFAFVFIKDFLANKDKLEPDTGWVTSSAIGFTTNFFDTLGIGSFAPTTALLKFFKQCQDKMIPGVLNVGCCIPVITEAIIFIDKVAVEPITLFSMLFASAVGAYFGAGIVSHFSEQKIRLVMGVALIITAFLMLAGIQGWMPAGGEAIGLTGGKLVFGIVANFILGALMTAGIGLYAPCMALVYLMGMSPLVAFPLMMGSCAVLMPVASYRFIKEKAYNRKASMAITVLGVIGVFIAAYIVTSLPLGTLRWLVIAVVLYTALAMLNSYRKAKG
jgi:uncharacterized membrane protein YfcA